MGLVDAVKKVLGRGGTEGETPDAGRKSQDEGPAEDLRVPEVTPAQLLAEMESGAPVPVLLDVRENYERAQSFIPGSLHIPMNSIPLRLAELDPGQDTVVYCAHGHRSYGVTGWLIQQGYKARSLNGGIAAWQQQRGPVESGYRARS